MTRLADDVARLRQVLARQNGPTVVAGHSYGGQIITALGTDTPNVVGLVYVAAFGLDEGESIGALLDQAPAGPALAHLDVDPEGFAVAPLAVLLDPLGDRHPQVGHGGAGVGEAELGVLDQVADDGGVVVRCQTLCSCVADG
jgi:pimeloyl-ACP methyl ester carboxylesterase